MIYAVLLLFAANKRNTLEFLWPLFAVAPALPKNYTLEHVQQWKFHTNFEHVENGFEHTFMNVVESGKKRLPPSILKTYLLFAFRCKEQKNLCVFLMSNYLSLLCR